MDSRFPSFFLGACIFLFFFFSTQYFVDASPFTSDIHSEHFFEILEDVDQGINYYEILRVQENATESEIKRSFRKLAVELHPDKNQDPNAGTIFRKVRFAYAVLSDNRTKYEFDDLLHNGIPWHLKYYGKYAHSWGAPDHDIRWVLGVTWLTILIGQYSYRWYWAWMARQDVIRYLKWKYPKLAGVSSTKRIKKKKKGESESDSEEKFDPFSELKLVEPKIIDLLAIQFVLLPYTACYWVFWGVRYAIWWKWMGKEPPAPDPEEEARVKAGMTPKEWKEKKARDAAKMEQNRTSNKAKQMRRYLKNHQPVSLFPDD